MKPIRFAVIGCGMLARQSHLPHLLEIPDAELHTCCDINDANLEAAKQFHPKKLSRDFREVIADPEVDALIVATTESFRVPIIEAAAAAKKPVYTEKPLADTLENALTIQRLVKESGIPFCVGHNRRCSPAMMDAHTVFTKHMRNPVPNPWRFQREGFEQIPVGDHSGVPAMSIRINDDWQSWKSVHMQSELNRKVGLVLSEGTHFVDMATWFLGGTPVSVYASGEGVLNHAMIIRYDNGALATITMASTGTFAYPKELFEAIGNNGVVVVDHMLEVRTAGIVGQPIVKKYPMLHDRFPEVGAEGGLYGWLEKRRAGCEEAVGKGDPMLQFSAEPDKGHKRMVEEFIREIRGERDTVCSVDSAVTALRICLAAAKSIIEERRVLLSEIQS